MAHVCAGMHVRRYMCLVYICHRPSLPLHTPSRTLTHTLTLSLAVSLSLSHLAAVVANFEFAHMRDGGRQQVRLAAVLYRRRLQAGQHCRLACLQELDDLCVMVIVCVCVCLHTYILVYV